MTNNEITKQFQEALRNRCLWMADEVVRECKCENGYEQCSYPTCVTSMPRIKCDNETICNVFSGLYPCPSCTPARDKWLALAKEFEPEHIGCLSLLKCHRCVLLSTNDCSPERDWTYRQPGCNNPADIKASLERIGEFEGFVKWHVNQVYIDLFDIPMLSILFQSSTEILLTPDLFMQAGTSYLNQLKKEG